MPSDYSTLKAYHRAHRDDFPESLSLRVHRALSWLARAQQDDGDADARFIFLWIAFNAAYAQDLSGIDAVSESRRFNGFIEKLCVLDSERELYNLVWAQYSRSIRLLLDNRYVFQPFWDFQNGVIEEDEWLDKFERFRAAAHHALGEMKTGKLLSIVFSNLYTLRNQLIHGGATWSGSVNREQVELGGQILGHVVPVVVDIMMHHPNDLWGDACYPVVK